MRLIRADARPGIILVCHRTNLESSSWTIYARSLTAAARTWPVPVQPAWNCSSVATINGWTSYSLIMTSARMTRSGRLSRFWSALPSKVDRSMSASSTSTPPTQPEWRRWPRPSDVGATAYTSRRTRRMSPISTPLPRRSDQRRPRPRLRKPSVLRQGADGSPGDGHLVAVIAACRYVRVSSSNATSRTRWTVVGVDLIVSTAIRAACSGGKP